MIIAITGGPNTGKSTLADEMQLKSGDELKIRRTDDFLADNPRADWSDISMHVAEWFPPGNNAWKMPHIIEGVVVPRALRKWLKKYPEGKPCDRAIYLWKGFEKLTPGQANMAMGIATVWDEIKRELEKRRVEIEYRPETVQL